MLTHFLPQCPYVVLSVGNTCRTYTAVDWHGKLHFRRENRKQNVYYVYEICSTILSEFKVTLQPPFGQFGGKLAKHKQTQQQKTQCVVFRKRVLIHLMIMTIWKHRDPIPFLLVHCSHFPTFCMLSKIWCYRLQNMGHLDHSFPGTALQIYVE